MGIRTSMNTEKNERLYWALRAAGLADTRTHELVMSELVRIGALAPDTTTDYPDAVERVRRQLGADFTSDEAWEASNDALFQLGQAALEWHEIPGELESRFPGYSDRLYNQVRTDMAFSMR